MDYKIYRLHGLDSAMHFLRPGAAWEITNSKFTRWEDPRPCPEWSEVMQTMEKLKALEDSINTVCSPSIVCPVIEQLNKIVFVSAIPPSSFITNT